MDLSAIVPSQEGIRGYNWLTNNEVTTNQSPGTTDLNTRYRYTPSTSADRTLTLPSVDSSQDGDFLVIQNASKYTITVDASDTDTIGWPALYVTSIEILPNALIVLRYDHTNTKWILVYKVGNQVRPAGTVLYLKFNELEYYDTIDGYGMFKDSCDRNPIYGLINWEWGSNTKFGGLCISFNGTSGYMFHPDSADWDVFGSTSNDCIVCGWVYCDDAIGSAEYLINQHEDANNHWAIYRISGGALALKYEQSASADININGGTLSQSTWHHVCMAKIGTETGIYIDGSQVAYDASFTADTFSATLQMGRWGGDGNYFDGKMQDWCIVYQNIFNAAPNSTPDDDITGYLDTLNPLNLVV